MAFRNRRLTAKAMEGADKIELSKTGKAIVVIHKASRAEVDPKTKVVKGHIFAEKHSYYPATDKNLQHLKEYKQASK